MSCFSEGYNQLRLFNKEEGKSGLYENQIGAIGATLAHFSTRKEPALITMPTGTGKTAVMIILSYALKANKILVVTPSQLVREQIVGHFRNPKLLIDKGIIQGGDTLPKVYELTNIINDNNEWLQILENYDVVIGIPGTLNKISNLGTAIGKDAFDVIFVDEAHHSRAESWTNILTTFSSAKQILLTATPFRRDKKDIRARLIYNYSLKQAYDDKLFSKINFVPVNTKLFDNPTDKNIAIAKKAESTYLAPSHPDHRIIVRTDRKSEANNLHRIYSEHTTLNLAVIHSKLSVRTIKTRIKQLNDGLIDGVICVDMMGEGYDFPALKIAAVHIPHKSLAITLQFVGRISRTNIVEGSEASVVAGEHEFKIESHQLYKQDSKDWSVVLPDLHKAKIQKTEDEQEFFDSFEEFTEVEPLFNIQSEEPISIENDDLKPFFHVKVYQITNLSHGENLNEGINISAPINFDGTDALINPVIRHHHVSNNQDVAIYVVSEVKTPSWYIKDDLLKDIKNELFIIYYDKDNSILFICSTIKDNELYELIAEQYLEKDVLHEIIPLPLLKRTMAGWHDPKMYNVGMKSRKTKGNSESYKQILGSLAQEGVLPTDKYSYTRGHSFGGAFDTVLKKDVLLGISISSKVWALQDGKIKYLVEWCKNIARKIGDPEMDKLNSPLSDLDCGKVIEEFPNEQIFFADWDSKQYHKLTSIVFLDNDDIAVEIALICTCSVSIFQQNQHNVILLISKGNISSKIVYTLKPRLNFDYAEDTEHKIAICRGASYGNVTAFLSIINESPINLFYENLSKLVGRVLFEFNVDNLKTISNDQIIPHNWPNTVNVQKEFYTADNITENTNALDNRQSIHDYIIDLAMAEYDVVFYDHASLEIADVIGFKKGKVQFFHCKKQNGDNPSCNIDDIYEVCGQAVKSIHWAHRGLLINQIYTRADRNNSHIKIKKGTLEQIKEILDSFENPIIPTEITIVHPGLKTNNFIGNQEAAFDRIKLLLSSAESFLKDVSSCSLSIMCS